ncbi:DDE-type integrase/transposase/recombinase [Actinomycetospora atypica]|uniref:DDE-type integrase/transposase/recombinase n=1 Tax=Actinomycetospora atypica TaxID=1290095 RepID=UPI00366CBCA7
MPALAAIDPITGEPVRRRRGGPRYERRRPGELLHVDVKKVGRVPYGGGWRVHGRQEAVPGRGIGYDYLHVAVDDHSRVAYIEALPDESDPTCAAFLHRAASWFHDHGIHIERVLTDNALSYRRGRNWRAVCVALGIRRRFTKPGCPWTNCEGVITPVPGVGLTRRPTGPLVPCSRSVDRSRGGRVRAAESRFVT